MKVPLPAGFFAANGSVFQRSIHGGEEDFGGAIGGCIRAIRMELDSTETMVSADHEWVPVKTISRIYASEKDAEWALARKADRS